MLNRNNNEQSNERNDSLSSNPSNFFSLPPSINRTVPPILSQTRFNTLTAHLVAQSAAQQQVHIKNATLKKCMGRFTKAA